jgi:hypothetical protein
MKNRIIFATFGISGFLWSRNYVYNHRFEAMKVRQNIKLRLESDKHFDDINKKLD